MLGLVIYAQVATEVECRARVETAEARMTELEVLSTAREAHMQERTAWALAREREIWQKDWEMRAATMDRKHSQFQIELALHQGYSMLLARELRMAHLPIPTAPKIPG